MACEACGGTEVVPVWDSPRRDDWHQQTCPVCQPQAAIPVPAPLRERLEQLHLVISRLLQYRQHLTGCEINQTYFCTCGLREAMDILAESWAALDAEGREESR